MRSQNFASIALKIRRGAKGEFFARSADVESNFRRVQADAGKGGAAVKRVAENRKSIFRGMNAYLMGAAGQGLGLDTS